MLFQNGITPWAWLILSRKAGRLPNKTSRKWLCKRQIPATDTKNAHKRNGVTSTLYNAVGSLLKASNRIPYWHLSWITSNQSHSSYKSGHLMQRIPAKLVQTLKKCHQVTCYLIKFMTQVIEYTLLIIITEPPQHLSFCYATVILDIWSSAPDTIIGFSWTLRFAWRLGIWIRNCFKISSDCLIMTEKNVENQELFFIQFR